MKYSRSSTMLKILLVTAMFKDVWTYKILLLPIPGKSHVFGMGAIAEGLVNRGHKVTLFIGQHFLLNLPELSNRTEFSVVRYNDTTDGEHMDYNAMEENYTKSIIESRGNINQLLTAVRNALRVEQWCQQLTVRSNDTLHKLEREKFDLALIEGAFIVNFVYLIPHRLQIPWITMSLPFDPFAIRVPWLPSFVPSMALTSSEQMTFIERLKNTAALFFLPFILSLSFPEPEQEVLDKFRHYGYFSSLDELVSKSAMWFLPKDNVLDYPCPTMPNMVDIGGLTVKRSTGKLPSDIKSFIDGARKGSILMTFGSATSIIPVHTLEKFSSVFGRLDDYRVIWRLENKDDVELPDNVMISQWLPQNDILAQPSVKLFITHCGYNGQHEAVYHGVPMIGFPIMSEQYYNAKRIEYKGYGLSMDLYDFTADQLFENIRKILGDESYKERVMKASEIFRSQAQSPVERATFWIEHVCQFGGDHLRSAGNDLPLYSYLMLDVLAFILIILHILIFLFFRLAIFILKKCRGQTKQIVGLTKKLN